MEIYIYQFFYISILSTILHFSYDMTNHMFLFSIIGAVNESTWEHLKIGVFPWISWFLIRSYYFAYYNSYLGNLVALLTFKLSIISIFYGAIFIMKRHYLPISIGSFYVGVLSGSFFEYLIKDYTFHPLFEVFGMCGCILIIVLVIIWTYYPYKCFLTLDVRYRLYGIEAHKKRCDILAKKKYIVFIFNTLGIPFQKSEYFEENSKGYHNNEEDTFRNTSRKKSVK